MRSILITGAAALLTITAPLIGKAAEGDMTNRFYGGLSLGASRLQHSDDNGSVFKLYGGYQITEHFGAEAGFMRLGDLPQDVKARAFYTAGTARWDLTSSFSVNGLLGVAYEQLDRDETAVLVGFGAQYRLSPRSALTVSFDHLADVTEEGASSEMVTAGFVMRF